MNKEEQQVLMLFWEGVNDAQASRQLNMKVVGAYAGHCARALRKLRMEYPASSARQLAADLLRIVSKSTGPAKC